ncbi:MAG: DUF4255 domain-containing protein [Bacteroidota bacterium]
MIYEAMSCIADELNEFFRTKLRINEDKVILSGIVNQDGSIAIQGENKVLVTLINIEREPSTKSNANALGARTFANTSSSMSVNIYVLFSSYFSGNNYNEALRFTSFVIAFMQEKGVFSQANTPRLDAGIEKLTFEMESLGSEKLNNVWATLGAKYMPSVMYKIRMLTFDSSVVREYRPSVSGVSRDNDAV